MDPNPTFVNMISKSFLSAYVKCTNGGLSSELSEAREPIPGVVCLAFAAETAIKAILYMEGNSIEKGHDLDVLYGKLSQSSKSSIEHSMECKKEDLQILLSQHRKAFEDWRYIYEKTQDTVVDFRFLEKFTKYLHQQFEALTSRHSGA